MKVLSTLILLVFFLGFSCVSYGQMKLQEIYGLQDKEALENIISDYEQKLEQNPNDIKTLKILGIAMHNLGISEVKGAPANSVHYLQKVYELHPDDYEVLAYLGSAKTMKARDSWNVITKVSSVNKGAKLMDRAVSKAPDNLIVRIVRANNSLSLPEFFKRKHLALKDLLHIERLMKEKEADFDIKLQTEVFYKIGKYYQEQGSSKEAVKYFHKAVQSSEDSKWGIQAKKEL